MTKIINSLYTVGNRDELELHTMAYETYNIIILQELYIIGQDYKSGKFFIQIRNNDGSKINPNYGVVRILLSAGENSIIYPLKNPSFNFTITLISETPSPEIYIFKIDFNEPTCPLNSLFQNLQYQEIAALEFINSQPNKEWKNFNHDHSLWEYLISMSQKGLLCYNNILDEPKIEDYS